MGWSHIHLLLPSPLISTTVSSWHPGTAQKVPGWERESRAEKRMVFNRYSAWRVREGRVVKLSVCVLKLNHTYFKANSGSFIQLPGSIDVTWTGSIYLPGEFRGEKSTCGSLCREITLVPSDSSVESVKHSDTDVSATSLARACPCQRGGASDMRED